MTVYADTPRWPRHGMLWGHLISDASLEELHRAAERAGLHPRSFDLDHYDWPQPRREDLLAAGVRLVGNRELTRLLLRSGLRVPLVERPRRRRERSEAAARALGLDEVPSSLVLGTLGHAEELPPAEQAPAGAYRLGRDGLADAPRIQAHDEAGRTAARAMLAQLDARAAARGLGERFVGQLLELPGSSSAAGVPG